MQLPEREEGALGRSEVQSLAAHRVVRSLLWAPRVNLTEIQNLSPLPGLESNLPLHSKSHFCVCMFRSRTWAQQPSL